MIIPAIVHLKSISYTAFIRMAKELWAWTHKFKEGTLFYSTSIIVCIWQIRKKNRGEKKNYSAENRVKFTSISPAPEVNRAQLTIKSRIITLCRVRSSSWTTKHEEEHKWKFTNSVQIHWYDPRLELKAFPRQNWQKLQIFRSPFSSRVKTTK